MHIIFTNNHAYNIILTTDARYVAFLKGTNPLPNFIRFLVKYFDGEMIVKEKE